MRRIECPAVRYMGEIYSGTCHEEAWQEVHDRFGYVAGGEEGFLTTDGKFVSRERAYRIAVRSGQMKSRMAREVMRSEDLYA